MVSRIHKITTQEYGMLEYPKLAIIWSRIWFVCFLKTKIFPIPDKQYIRTWYGADYGNLADQFFPFGFSYIEKVAPGSITSAV